MKLINNNKMQEAINKISKPNKLLESKLKRLNEATGNFAYENRCILVTEDDIKEGNVPETDDRPINNNRTFPQYPLIDYNDGLKFHSIVLTPGYYEGACIDYVNINDEDDLEYYDWLCQNIMIDNFIYKSDAINKLKSTFRDFPVITEEDFKSAIQSAKDKHISLSNEMQSDDSPIRKKIIDTYEKDTIAEAKKCDKILDEIKREYGYKELKVSARFSNGETMYSVVDEKMTESLNEEDEGVELDDRAKALIAGLQEENPKEYADVTIEKVDEDRHEYSLSNGATYVVLDDDEADEAVIDSVENFIDDIGVTGFTPDFQEWIYTNAFDDSGFYDIMREDYEQYYYDLDDADVISEAEELNLLDAEDEDNADADDIDSLRERLIDYHIDDEPDAVTWFRDNFGDDAFNKQLSRMSYALDMKTIAEEATYWDGRGHFLSTYDGDELELPDGYYGYRID